MIEEILKAEGKPVPQNREIMVQNLYSQKGQIIFLFNKGAKETETNLELPNGSKTISAYGGNVAYKEDHALVKICPNTVCRVVTL